MLFPNTISNTASRNTFAAKNNKALHTFATNKKCFLKKKSYHFLYYIFWYFSTRICKNILYFHNENILTFYFKNYPQIWTFWILIHPRMLPKSIKHPTPRYPRAILLPLRPERPRLTSRSSLLINGSKDPHTLPWGWQPHPSLISLCAFTIRQTGAELQLNWWR